MTRAPEHPDSVREALREARTRKGQADRDRADAMLDIGEWVRRGRTTGMSITELADLAGVSRPTVYAILEDHGTT